MDSYNVTKNKIFKYLDDRKKYLSVYDEIKNNINTFETIIEAYDYFDYVPKEIVKTFLMHLGKVIEDNSDVFNTDHRQ
jgi:hypothetical protein